MKAAAFPVRPSSCARPCFLARMRKIVGPDFPLIGVGGINSVETAWTKLAAGADLIQVYTGFIYEGQGIAAAINRGLAERLQREGIASIAEVTGTATDHWASQAL